MNQDLFRQIVEGFSLDLQDIHGIHHWARVFENGRRLSALTGADPLVVELFAVFHDCRRLNDGDDPAHGRRGGGLARTLRKRGILVLTDDQCELLDYACAHHSDGLTEADVTVQTCWDADRLDLGRVWVTPDPRYLCTPAAKDPEMIAWADERARAEHRPAVFEDWLK
jgi:uncharacterized protein